MNTSGAIRIATHDGSFHADDVLAIAILTTIFPKHTITRTRDLDLLEMMDIVVDVGDVYDHRARRYDHHMHNPPTDKHDHILSSAGLIWRHYSKAYLNSIDMPKSFTFKDQEIDLITALEKNIRTHWIYPIDRADNGLSQGPTTISEIVRSLRPTNPEKSRAVYNKMFLEAVSLVSYLFKRSCFHAADHIVAKIKCQLDDKVYLSEGKVVISQHPLHNYKSFYPTPAHFVISPSQHYEGSDDYYIIRPILDSSTKQFKTAFPTDVLGTRSETIEANLDVKGVTYIHHAGHLALAESQNAAIDVCLKLLELDRITHTAGNDILLR